MFQEELFQFVKLNLYFKSMCFACGRDRISADWLPFSTSEINKWKKLIKEMPGESDKAPFSLPEIQVNPSGWGPSTIETKFKDMPYQPFSKSDRLGKVSFHL